MTGNHIKLRLWSALEIDRREGPEPFGKQVHNVLINSSQEHWESLRGPPDGTADAPISLTPTGSGFVWDNPASFVLKSEGHQRTKTKRRGR